MTKEQFEAIGISKEMAEKAAEQSAEELKEYVPKHRFDEVNTENKNLKAAAKENEQALEELKENAGDSEGLKKQIQKMQDDAKEMEEKHKEEIRDMQINNAIKLSLTGKAQDAEIVAGLIDKTKLILGDDGKITGLDEQVKALKENKSFLFVEEKEGKEQPPVGGFTKIGAQPPAPESGERHVSLADGVKGFFSSQQTN